MRKHYFKDEKIKILKSFLPAIFEREIIEIAEAIEYFAFFDLKDLIKALEIFAKGKK